MRFEAHWLIGSIAGVRRRALRLSLATCVFIALVACKRPTKPTEWDEESVEPGHFLIEIAGSSDSDVWALSNDFAYHYGGARWDTARKVALRKVSMAAPGDVWFGGYMGTVMHCDAKGFETLVIEEARKRYWDVSALAAWPGEVWVGFSKPGYFRKQGQMEWAYVEPPALAGFQINAIWGKTKDDVWASIFAKRVVKLAHFRSGSWTVFDRAADIIAGSSTNDVWFKGLKLTHWDGATLTDYPLPEPNARIYALAVRSPNDAMAVGASGVALRWDGSKWRALPRVSNYDLNRVFVSPAGRYRAIFQGSVLVRNAP